MPIIFIIGLAACQIGGERGVHQVSQTEQLRMTIVAECTQNVKVFQQKYKEAQQQDYQGCLGKYNQKQCQYYYAYRMAANLDSLRQTAKVSKNVKLKAEKDFRGKINKYAIAFEKLGIDFSLPIDSLTNYYLTNIKDKNIYPLGMVNK